MIDPIHSLAFSVQSNPGVYAILIGSGISRAAGIPTGWEITLDLVKKLAVLCDEPCEPDPENWYLKKFGKAPEYSDLLDSLVKSPTERQQLLRDYWEPNDQEQEEGAKQPTSAHRAIAELAKRGFIKVIITTNFDRLMETALADVGVMPTVLSSPDQVRGSVPLIHTRCCVFKVNGDYLDTRIRNTPSELSAYPAEFDQLLDRVFDEFGLIICGWSADWDLALRAAVVRAPSRRFTTYWAARGEPKDEAKRLIDHRSAQIIPIKDADFFFQSLRENVESLEEFSKPHPLSTQAAVTSLKRYLSGPRYRIQLADLINEVVGHAIETTSTSAFAIHGGAAPDGSLLSARVRGYEAAFSTLLAMAPIGGFWAEEENYSAWQRALERLMAVDDHNGYDLWLRLLRYPGTLLVYALGLGAVEGNRLGFLGKLFTTKTQKDTRDVNAVEILPPFRLLEPTAARLLPGMKDRRAPLNDWLYGALRQYTKPLIPVDDRYQLVFDKLEILIALSFVCHAEKPMNGRNWAPPGAYGYRSRNAERILQEIEDSISRLEGGSPFVVSHMFGDTVETCTNNMASFKEFLSRLHDNWAF